METRLKASLALAALRMALAARSSALAAGRRTTYYEADGVVSTVQGTGCRERPVNASVTRFRVSLSGFTPESR